METRSLVDWESAILDHISREPTASLRDIGKAVGCSYENCAIYIRRLEAEGIISVIPRSWSIEVSQEELDLRRAENSVNLENAAKTPWGKGQTAYLQAMREQSSDAP